MKLAGSLFVLTASFLIWFQTMRGRRARRETLRDLIAALTRMEEEIRMARPPLPWLLERAAKDCGAETAAFFRTGADALRRGEAWMGDTGLLPLTREEQRIVRELCRGIRGDEEEVRGALRHAAGQLRTALERWEEQRRGEERQLTALCFSGGLLLVILLI